MGEGQLESQDSRRGSGYTPSLRRFAKPFLISLRALAAIFLAAWFVTLIYEIGSENMRVLLLLGGVSLSWWTVGMLED